MLEAPGGRLEGNGGYVYAAEGRSKLGEPLERAKFSGPRAAVGCAVKKMLWSADSAVTMAQLIGMPCWERGMGLGVVCSELFSAALLCLRHLR